MRRFYVSLFVAIFWASCTSGCSLFHFDQRSQIAYRTLFDNSGEPDVEALTQSLSAKFPPGAPVDSLRQFIRDLSGSCNEPEPNHMWCYIPTHGFYCYSYMIGLDVTIESDTIVYLRASSTGVGC